MLYLSDHKVRAWLCGATVIVLAHAATHPGVAGQVQVLDQHGGLPCRHTQRDSVYHDLHILLGREPGDVPPQHLLLAAASASHFIDQIDGYYTLPAATSVWILKGK